MRLQRDVLADQSVEHARRVVHDGIHLEVARLHRLAPAEGEQLPGERRRPLGRRDDVLENGAHVRRRQLGHERERGVALDDHEEIVEVVRDTAGELADRVHLLRLEELLLELALLGDVVAEYGDTGDLFPVPNGIERFRQDARTAQESAGHFVGETLAGQRALIERLAVGKFFAGQDLLEGHAHGWATARCAPRPGAGNAN